MPDQPLTSSRLLYRKFAAADLHFCRLYYQNEQCMHFIIGRALNEKETEAKLRQILLLDNGQALCGMFKVFLADGTTFAGLAKFEVISDGLAEVGYGLLPEYWGSGYASEILSTLIGWAGGFPEVDRLVGVINPLNTASKAVLTKQGFKEGKAFPEAGNNGNGYLYLDNFHGVGG